MKFAHLADCHIGSWRDPNLSSLSTLAFEKTIDKCINLNVDFILIAGDLFNTSLPSIDSLKKTTQKLKELRDKDIPCYIIAGSHDFSPSGKTMLDVLENAGLCKNVAIADIIEEKIKLKFTVDKKTGTKITGLLGKKGGLEKNYYESLLREPLESESGYKIFMFHSLLTELKPTSLEKVDSQALSLLPKNFNYYAGGHPHFVHTETRENYGRISYPGPLFPNNFKELEELQHGGFYLIEDEKITHIPINLYDIASIKIDTENKSADEINSKLRESLDINMENKIVTLRAEGKLSIGKPSDIEFSNFYKEAKEKGAYAILKNSSKLTSKEIEDIKIEISDVDDLEKNLIDEQILSDDLKGNAQKLATELLSALDTTKSEGERVYDFEKRIIEEIDKII